MIDAATRRHVRERAGNRCEYCQLPQSAGDYYAFHIEHIIARQHGGSDTPDNLCLACPECNRCKGPNLTTIDHDTGSLVRLFHPRRDDWRVHFAITGAEITGLTAVGKATVALLCFNEIERVLWREELISNHEFE